MTTLAKHAFLHFSMTKAGWDKLTDAQWASLSTQEIMITILFYRNVYDTQSENLKMVAGNELKICHASRNSFSEKSEDDVEKLKRK